MSELSIKLGRLKYFLWINASVVYVAAANSLTRNDHGWKLLPGKPSKLFQPVCVREESEWRLVRTPVSVPVKGPVGFWRSDSSGCQQNTISQLGGLDLLHPKVVNLAPPYSQCYSHAIWYTNTSKLITYRYGVW